MLEKVNKKIIKSNILNDFKTDKVLYYYDGPMIEILKKEKELILKIAVDFNHEIGSVIDRFMLVFITEKDIEDINDKSKCFYDIVNNNTKEEIFFVDICYGTESEEGYFKYFKLNKTEVESLYFPKKGVFL